MHTHACMHTHPCRSSESLTLIQPAALPPSHAHCLLEAAESQSRVVLLQMESPEVEMAAKHSGVLTRLIPGEDRDK